MPQTKTTVTKKKISQDSVKKSTTSKKIPLKEEDIIALNPNKKNVPKWEDVKQDMKDFKTPDQVAKEQNLEKIIEIKNLVKNYGKLHVLKNVNLNIYGTQDIAVIGANGAGKSTISEIIALVKEKTSGEVKYSWGDTKRQISRGLGIQFQESTYPEGYRIIDLIMFYLEVNGINIVKKGEEDKLVIKKMQCDECKKSFFAKVSYNNPYYEYTCRKKKCGYTHKYNFSDKFITEDKFNYLLETFQVNGITHKMANAVSGGQQQRFNILLGVLHQPKFLILDEVSTGLDVESRAEIKSFVKQVMKENEGTLYLVTHNMDEVEFLSKRITIIDAGRVVDDVMISDIWKIGLTVAEYVDSFFDYRDRQLKASGKSKNDQS